MLKSICKKLLIQYVVKNSQYPLIFNLIITYMSKKVN